MNSLQKTLQFIVDNWSQIIIILTLLLTIYTKLKKFIEDWKNKTEAEKKAEAEKAFNKAVETAKKALADYILILVSKAEIDWQSEDGKLGKTKRAQVIEEIYKKYPILEQVEDKKELLAYIDNLINEALKTVREELRQPAKTLEEKIVAETERAINE
jgi:hypothetical protein